MARFPLDIPPGLVSDDTPFSTKGSWRDADKVRFWRGKGQVIGGWQSLTTDLLTGVCRAILPWADNATNLNVAFGTHTKLLLLQGGTTFDITPTTFVPGSANGTGGAGYGTGLYGSGTYGTPSTVQGFAMTWSLSNYGQSLMANPRDQTIFWWQNVNATPAAPLTNAPSRVTFSLVTPQRQVIAFGCNEVLSGVYNPLAIRGSDIEGPTTWTPTTANNAFEDVLPGGGRIVGARLIGAFVFVWTDTDLYLGTFLGDPAQTYRFDRVDTHCGLVGPNAAVVMGQTAYWLSPDLQFRSCALGGQVETIACPIRDDFALNLATVQQDKIVLSTCAQYEEMRMDYPDGRDGVECSRYLVANTQGQWSRGKMARTFYIDVGPTAYPLATTPQGNAYYQEAGQSADGGAIAWSLTSSDQYVASAENTLVLSGIWPDFSGQVGSVNLMLYPRLFPQAIERTKGPFILQPGQQKRDFRATGRIMRVAFSGFSSPAACRFGSPTFEATSEGLR